MTISPLPSQGPHKPQPKASSSGEHVQLFRMVYGRKKGFQAKHALVQATVGVEIVIIRYIGVAYTRGGGYAVGQFREPMWFKAGPQVLPEGNLDHLGSANLVRAQCILAILTTKVVPMGAVEAYPVYGGQLGPDLDLQHPPSRLG